ncbi:MULTISPECIES: exodeoxyribonuclease V subunit gamma [unclassified Moraxella]|uniref:exodeoxyribonuclease V subunit gamma n=1 Tax=unclassified Moraxella TaxID=2685852 RepID=UPI003AF595A7
MLKIIQSNQLEQLFSHLLDYYKTPNAGQSVFEPFHVIVPSKVMGEWLKKQVADQAGISTLVTTEFWGRFYWGLMQRVLRTYAHYREGVLSVPEVAMLSRRVMQWQIFGFLMRYQAQIMADESHPLYAFVSPLLEASSQATEKLTEQQLAGLAPVSPIDSVASERLGGFNNQSLVANHAISEQAHIRSQDQRLWQLASDMASMLNRYMTYRPQWLEAWGQNQPIAVVEMIQAKDTLHNRMQGRFGDNAVTTPEWLVAHYQALEQAQRFLWRTLFDDDYRYRKTLQAQFWQAFEDNDERIAKLCQERLPKQLILFTIQQLPPSELLDLQKLGKLTDVVLLHFNPSEQFWADIVDKNWLMQQQFDQPQNLYLKDYGHTLLSRFGKQSREVFAMLANLSGNEYGEVIWQDDFIDNPNPQTLLAQLQQDILMLEEGNTSEKIHEMLAFESNEAKTADNTTQQALQKIQQLGLANNQAFNKILAKLEQEFAKEPNQRQWQGEKLIDSSLSIHACHGMVRQLEVLRMMLVGWLNGTDLPKDCVNQEQAQAQAKKRSLSDILVLVPDIEAQQNVIEAIFPKGVGADGYSLPAKVTGVVGKEINQLWQAIVGYYQLLNRTGARFAKAEVFDWLMLPPLYESFGLTLEQMSRGCELLTQAGFIRGFDEAHLQQNLHTADDDYRYSFAFALERLVAGVLMPHASGVQFGEYVNRHGERERIAPLDSVSMNDASVVAVLCQIYQTLHQKRDMGQMTATVGEWLDEIEALIKGNFASFNQTNAWLAIFSARNELKNNIEANQKASQKHASQRPEILLSYEASDDTGQLPLKLNFVLESIAEQLVSQQVSAEPSGVITFARMGAVRNLPYPLVVMLNLNLTDFPQREPLNRYNLIQAGLPVRGDRFREDDDLGAFLDALLCAKQACWLFYNGSSTTDTHEHLPASPVQELLDFLQTEVAWQDQQGLFAVNVPTIETANENDSESDDNKDKHQMVSQFSQKVEQYLVTHHPALPFDKQYFELGLTQNVETLPFDKLKANVSQTIQLAKTKLYPPAPIWHELYQQLTSENTTPHTDKVTIWGKTALKHWLAIWQQARLSMTAMSTVSTESNMPNTVEVTTHYEHLGRVVRALQDPAKAFVQAQQIFIPPTAQDGGYQNSIDKETALEPVVLDHLSRYQLNKLLLEQLLDSRHDSQVDDAQSSPVNSLAFSQVLPAGVNRYQSLIHEQQQLTGHLRQLVSRFAEFASADNTDGEANENHQHDLSVLKQRLRSQFVGVTEELQLERFMEFITPCHEQRLAVNILALDAQDANTTTPSQSYCQQRLVLTAVLPVADEQASYWFQYLPYSGREKYWVQFWLNHLAWQVARRTTLAQVAEDDGFSLWQFSRQKTLYLPAIEWQTAEALLQDWLMVWQLLQQQVVILPPSTSMAFLQGQREIQDKAQNTKSSTTPLNDLTKSISTWFNTAYNQSPTVENADYVIWQTLLGDKKPTVILPFLQILGEWLYQPLLDNLVDVFAE